MDTPHPRKRKACAVTPTLEPKVLFTAMAYDLRLTRNAEYLDALALLANGKYLSFLKALDGMTAQMYQSVGDERYRLHQLAALLSKYPFEDPSLNRTAVALEKFRQSEHRCRRMNQKLRLRRGKVEPPHMQHMRDYIMRVLGATPNYANIYANCDFGPGSSVGVHGADTSVLNKLDKLTCTPALAPVALTALRQNIHYTRYISDEEYRGPWSSDVYDVACPGGVRLEDKVEYVQYNKITCVPKNAKTDRTIAIEPTLNGFVQKGIDIAMRKSLLRVGIDLKSQGINQALARLGSIGRGYATIDLSAASDSLSVELVRELLPPEWFLLLNTARSPSYKLPKERDLRRYEKFCSMGNGFCFPLETLIFCAACDYAMTVTQTHIHKTMSVYGDDIIVPQECALLLLEVLRDVGFRHNEEKTFIIGGFRESCGADYFFGENVRPLYVKAPLKTWGLDTFAFLNALRQRKLMETWQRVFDAVPGAYRYLRPFHREDDSAITVPIDIFMSSKHARWCRDTFAWTWKGLSSSPTAGRKPVDRWEYELGLFRGDLRRGNAFSARFSERTRVQPKS